MEPVKKHKKREKTHTAPLGSDLFGDDESYDFQNDDDTTINGANNDDNGITGSKDDPPLFQLLTGMREDLRVRWPLYSDDWSRPRSICTVVNASLFAFVIQMIPALIFSELMDVKTNGQLATAEVLLSTAIMGILYAIFSGQPLVILGVTGPVAILLGTSYSLTETFNVKYFPFFFWICIWAGAFHMITAMVGLVSLVWKITPFTTQIYELFVGLSFAYNGVRDLLVPMAWAQPSGKDPQRGPEYAAFVVGIITFTVSYTLHYAETWIYFTRQIRSFLKSYNNLVALVVGTAFSYLPGVDQSDESGEGGIQRVNIRFVPWDWQPTADRSWLVNPFNITGTGILAAIIPGLMFFMLFIIDHNVSSILTQLPKFNLKKPPAYHWDFFVLGWTFLPCAIMGLPPGNALVPQAPLYVRTLCTREIIRNPFTGAHREVLTQCEEQRWSSLLQASLMFVALSSYRILSWIPHGCLFGLLLYLGVTSLLENEIWERVTFCFMVPKKRPDIPVITSVSWRALQAWTAIQVGCALAIFAIAEFTSFGYIFPVLLLGMVPLRSYVLWFMFREEDIAHLDPDNESEEDFHDQQRRIILAHRNSALDNEEEAHIPSRAEFRCKAVQKAMQDHARLRALSTFSDGVRSVMDHNDDSKSKTNSVKGGDDLEAAAVAYSHEK